MPFGLRNAAQTFQRFTDQVVWGLDFIYADIDDLLVASESEEEHAIHLRELFALLKRFGLVVNPSRGRPGRLSVYLCFTKEALVAFTAIKTTMAEATMLVHPDLNAKLCLLVDASDTGVGAVLQQQRDNYNEPLAFFSKRLSPVESRYSTFGHELLAIYLAVKHLRHVLKGSHFTIYAGHKPLTYALSSHSDRYSPREVRHLNYISQYCSDIRHIKGQNNVVADALSRTEMNVITEPIVVNFPALADAQNADAEILHHQGSSTLDLQPIPVATSEGTILCDVSTSTLRPFVPECWRRLYSTYCIHCHTREFRWH